MPRRLAICLWIMLGLVTAGQRLLAGDLACLTCHSAPSFREASYTGKASIHVDYVTLASSVHSRNACVDCHIDFRGKTLPHKGKAAPVDCVRCHHNGNHVGAPAGQHVDLYADSVHGNALRSGDSEAPSCKSCHGAHDIRPAKDPLSSMNRANIADTCGKCHFDAGFAGRHRMSSVQQYRDSIHARMIPKDGGIEIAAVCTDCHGVHDIRSPGRADSSVNRLHVPATCGKCHKQVLADYEESVHGRAAARGAKSAPVCTDCHGEHLVSKPSSPGSPVNPSHVVATCSKCHENARIQRRYGLPTNRLSSYRQSYHGVANAYGDLSAANCATCHGAHAILPSSDPRSTVSHKNLPKTCGTCHPGASRNFAVGSIHVVPTPTHDAAIFWVRTLYMLFVAGLMSSFVGYILLDLRARATGRLPWKIGDRS